MLNNLINMNDFTVLFDKISRQGVGTVASRIFRNDQDRVRSVWSETQSAPTHWWDIPEVRQRWNEKITGERNTECYEYIRERYFSGPDTVNGLSIGCGSGFKEVKWAAAIPRLTLLGTDISPERIRFAGGLAEEAQLNHRLTFAVSDVAVMHFVPQSFDLIIFDSALHHLTPVAGILDRIRTALRPGGILIVNEYVGPSRFQWTDEQLTAVNEVLTSIPESYRKFHAKNTFKQKVYRPGRLSMYISDPSEAVESHRIEEELTKRFTVLEKKEYGGTILQPLLNGIAHNFVNGGQQSKEILHQLFDAEDRYLSNGRLKSDFIFFVAAAQHSDH